MRVLALFLLLMVASAHAADDDYRPAIIVDAGQDTELRAGVFGGVTNANANTITVELDGMRYTANYQTILPNGRNASSHFVVGAEVMARVHRDKFLWILREDGKPLKVRITRREIVR